VIDTKHVVYYLSFMTSTVLTAKSVDSERGADDVQDNWRNHRLAGTALVFAAVAIRFLRPEWNDYAYWGAWPAWSAS